MQQNAVQLVIHWLSSETDETQKYSTYCNRKAVSEVRTHNDCCSKFPLQHTRKKELSLQIAEIALINDIFGNGRCMFYTFVSASHRVISHALILYQVSYFSWGAHPSSDHLHPPRPRDREHTCDLHAAFLYRSELLTCALYNNWREQKLPEP